MRSLGRLNTPGRRLEGMDARRRAVDHVIGQQAIEPAARPDVGNTVLGPEMPRHVLLPSRTSAWVPRSRTDLMKVVQGGIRAFSLPTLSARSRGFG